MSKNLLFFLILRLHILLQAIRPYSEETRAIQAVADEFHLRTALDIINSLSVDSGSVGMPENDQRVPECTESPNNVVHPFIIQAEQVHPPVLTTATYAETNQIVNVAEVIEISHVDHQLSNIFPVADPVFPEEQDQKEESGNEQKNS
jgi:hypothetical protein